MASTLKIEVKVLKLGEGYLAVTELGGITVRGRRLSSPLLATQSLLYKLGEWNQHEDEPAIALELALHGTSIGTALELEAGLDKEGPSDG